jgi:hypothetical protein
MSTAIEEVTIPSTIGTAIGSITSLPMPLSKFAGRHLALRFMGAPSRSSQPG